MAFARKARSAEQQVLGIESEPVAPKKSLCYSQDFSFKLIHRLLCGTFGAEKRDDGIGEKLF